MGKGTSQIRTSVPIAMCDPWSRAVTVSAGDDRPHEAGRAVTPCVIVAVWITTADDRHPTKIVDHAKWITGVAPTLSPTS